MGSQLGPRIPQVTNTLVLIDPANSAGITNPYTNLITSPEDLSVGTTSNSTITANAVSAPDGTITADSLYDNTSAAVHSVSRNISTTVGVTYTMSVFAKAGTLNQFVIIIDGNLYGRLYRLSNGTTGSVSTTPTSWSLTQLSDGWWRASLTYVATSSSTQVVIWTATNDSFSYAGSGGGYLHLWGLQLTATATLQEYTAQSRISDANKIKDLSTPLSTVVNSVSLLSNVVQGQSEYTTPGLYNWQCPPNVNSVSILCVGGGGGGGGGGANAGGGAGGNLRYSNNISVTPGQTYQVFVGAGGARGVSSGVSGQSGTASSFAGLVVAQGGGAGTTAAGATTTGGNAGTGSNGGPGGTTDGGGGGAGGYVVTVAGGSVVQVSATQFDATSLGPVTSVDQIGAHSSASLMASSGFLKYTLAKASGINQQIVVSYRKTGTTISQSAWTTDAGVVNYTSAINSILFYANDDHDTMWMDADGSGIISRINTNSLNSGTFDKFRGTSELINNAALDSVATYPTFAALGTNSTIVSFPLTTSSIVINLSSSVYKVNNGSLTALPSPLSGIGTTGPTNSIWTISDGVNQFLIGRYGVTTAYLVTVDLSTNTVSASSISITSPVQSNLTEEDAIGTQLFAVDGVANWNQNCVYYYGGTLDWKTNTNVFNTSGKLTFTSGITTPTQTDMDIWGSIDATGFVWFADWGHDDGGLFGVGNDSQLGTRQTNIRYCTSFVSGDFVGVGGGIGGNQGGSAPGIGIGGGGGGGGGGTGGAGGGGVGIYGQGANGVAGVTKASLTDGIQQGGGGSSGTGGAIKNQGADLTAQTGGLYGGGGGGGSGGGPGGGGAVRIIWGPGRSYPLSAADVSTTTGSLSATTKLDSIVTLTSTNYNSGYLEFAGTTSSYTSISNVESSDYITVTAAVFVSNWTTASGVILSNADTDGTNRYIIDVNGLSAGNLAVTFNSRAGNVTATYARSSIAAGWHILTAVFDGSAAYLYIDGVIASSTSASSTTVLNPPGSYNTTTLGAKLTGSVASNPLACRIGYLNITAGAYSAADALSAYNNVRGRYGI